MKKSDNQIFSESYLVNSYFLNLLGLQAFRYISASLVYWLRGIFFKWDNSKEVKILKKEGLLIINNFLNMEDFEKFRDHFKSLQNIGLNKILNDGDSSTERSTLSIEQIENNEILTKIVCSKKLINILESCEHKKFIKNRFHNFGKYGQIVWLDKINNIGFTSIKDSQKTLHSDIFFHTHKVWYFPSEVNAQSGPLNFVKGSHKFSFKRMYLEYINSIDERTNTQSPNIRNNKQPLNNYEKNSTICNVSANTLVIANTRGYHKRGNSFQGTSRMQLHFRVRRNPFEKIFIQ